MTNDTAAILISLAVYAIIGGYSVLTLRRARK